VCPKLLDHYRYQVDKLLDDAKKNNLVPLYCMYSNWDTKKYKASWNCQTYKSTARHYGASILNPLVVKKLQATKSISLSSIIGDLKPLHCIFCCNGCIKGDLPTRAFYYLVNTGLVKSLDNLDLLLQDEPPYYVSQILEGELGNDLADVLDENLKRVTIIKELSDD
jgi:hypothetical protein